MGTRRPWKIYGRTAGSDRISSLWHVNALSTRAKAEGLARKLIERGDPRSAKAFRDYVVTVVSAPDGRTVARFVRAGWDGLTEAAHADTEVVKALGR